MKPLLILLAAFVISLATIKIAGGKYNYALAGTIAMTVMLLFTSVAHFAFTKGMTMMVPGFIPFKKELVYATGIIEILAAIGLLIPGWRVLTAWLLVGLFLLLLPANINAAIRHIDYQQGTSEGAGINYLWFRIPLQVLFIGWVYFFIIKRVF